MPSAVRGFAGATRIFLLLFFQQEGIMWEFVFPTPGLEVSCKGKLVAAARAEVQKALCVSTCFYILWVT